MFLLVSVRHVGAHPGGLQHGVSIQISINLGKTFLRISRILNIILTWILARVFVYLSPFISQIPDFICWTVLIFILMYFEYGATLKTSNTYPHIKFQEKCSCSLTRVVYVLSHSFFSLYYILKLRAAFFFLFSLFSFSFFNTIKPT